jgi:transposase
MDDGLLIGNEDLGSTRMRAREVRGEVLTGPERRRRWSVEEKLRILAQSVAPGSSVMLVCRMHGISSGQLYTWRRQFRTGELTGCAGDAGPTGWATGGTFATGRSGTNPSASQSADGRRDRGGAALGGEAADHRCGRRDGAAPGVVGTFVIGIPGNIRVYLACGVTDMRKAFDGLAARVQTVLQLDPHGGALFVFRGRRGDLLKVLWWDGQGLCLFAKRLERGRFIWPQAKDGSVVLTAAQLSMLLEGIDWRAPRRSWTPEAAG